MPTLAPSSVDRIYGDFKAVSALLDPVAGFSIRSSVDDLYRKALLLAAASWFEHSVTETITKVARGPSGLSGVIVNFLKNKAIHRQFHSYFDWDSTNAWRFFGLFGEDFREYARAQLSHNPGVEEAISAFVEIGRDRNRMVHQDYGSYSLEKTSDEIYSLYRCALPFVEGLEVLLTGFTPSMETPSP